MIYPLEITCIMICASVVFSSTTCPECPFHWAYSPPPHPIFIYTAGRVEDERHKSRKDCIGRGLRFLASCCTGKLKRQSPAFSGLQPGSPLRKNKFIHIDKQTWIRHPFKSECSQLCSHVKVAPPLPYCWASAGNRDHTMQHNAGINSP